MLLRVFDSGLTIADLITPASAELVDTEADAVFRRVSFPLAAGEVRKASSTS